jgi:hypothetical protein
MAPQVKDPTWIHVDVDDDDLYCKYYKKYIKRGHMHRLKQHFTGQRGQVAPSNTKDIGPIKLEMQNVVQKFKEDKARQKEIRLK